PESWRDTAARLQGPIVARAQSVFAQHWMEETGEPLTGGGVFPPLEPAGSTTAHLVSSSPRGGVSSVSILYRYVIAAARREILIQNPYFCPGHEAIGLLVAAARRGVEIRIMLPGRHTDSPVARHAGHRHYARLLAAGIEIWEHEVTVPHQKVVVVDRVWSHIGSTNFDPRSFDINAEVSLGVLGPEIADELKAAFEDDLEGAERITAPAWARRPRSCRIADRLAFLVHEQL
ncbi:MAG: phospholipase D-like domain-containing protein, partial [Halobacteriales archaeon]|nr:phospholipase D-like domain-containing protein [Halobacteriales archaeon]